MEVQLFKHPSFGEIRTMVMPDGQVGFVGKDVAEVLGYERPDNAIRNHVEDDDKLMHQISASGQRRNVWFINESGLYSLILSSKLPQAREFKHWVTSEVLPQIRKTGGYIPVKEEDDEKTILCKALMIYKRTVEEKEKLIEEQRPLVNFAKALDASEASIHISEMAKLLTENGYETGRRRFFTWLREHGFIFKTSTEPMQEWVTKGIFEVKVSLVDTHHGPKETITPMVTAKGQRYFIERLCDNQGV